MKTKFRCYFLILFFFITLLEVGCMSLKNTSEKPQVTVSSFFNPSEYEKIAILVEDNTGEYYRRNKGILHNVENLFTQAALKNGYRLANRSETEQIKKELEFESDGSGWTARDRIKPGNFHNVTALWIVSINESYVHEKDSILSNFLDEAPDEIYYSVASISANLISVREAEVLWSGSYTGSVQISDDNSRRAAIPIVSKTIAEKLTCRNC